MNHLERFDKFWSTHPARNGRKVGKPEAKKKFLKLSDKDSTLILQATKNYRDSKDVRAGIGIRDPHRFIKDGRGNERWREYIHGEIKPVSKAYYSTPEERKKDADNLRTGKTLSFQEIAKRLKEYMEKRKGDKK